jgi:hypothetical protein
MSVWRNLNSTQRQAQKLINSPTPTTETRLLSFNRIKSRVITGLFTGHNSLRRHLYIMGYIDSPICRRCGTKEDTARVLCECKALATLTHTYLCSFFLEPEYVRSLSLREIWNFTKGTGLPWLWHWFKGHKGLVKKAYVLRDRKSSNHFTILFYSILVYSILV